MLVYLAAGITALIYLMALPVRAGAAWRTGAPLRLGVTVGPVRFSARGGIKYVSGLGLTASLTHDRSGKVRELSLANRLSHADELTERLSALRGALRYLSRHTHPWRLRARIHLSLPDAAKTAFLYGALNSGLSAFRAVRPDLPLSASVTADFRSGHTQFDLCGILSCRLGHIMVAGLIWCRDYLTRRIHTWITNNRSKAS